MPGKKNSTQNPHPNLGPKSAIPTLSLSFKRDFSIVLPKTNTEMRSSDEDPYGKLKNEEERIRNENIGK